MIINTFYKTDTLIDGIKYNPPSEINNNTYTIELIWKNENGPVVIKYYKNGNISYKAWYINDKLHNENGSAIIEYDQNGNITKQQY